MTDCEIRFQIEFFSRTGTHRRTAREHDPADESQRRVGTKDEQPDAREGATAGGAVAVQRSVRSRQHRGPETARQPHERHRAAASGAVQRRQIGPGPGEVQADPEVLHGPRSQDHS